MNTAPDPGGPWKGYRSAAFERQLADAGITLVRPAAAREPPRPHQRFLRPLRQIIESTIQTLKAQLGLERHGGRTPAGVAVRVLQRLLASDSNRELCKKR